MFLLIIPIAMAYDIKIIIQTDNPGHGMVIRIKDPSTLAIIDTIYPGKTGPFGKAIINYSTSRSELAFSILIVLNGKVISSEDFGAQSTSGPIYLNFTSKKEETNNVSVNKTSEVNETLTNETSINENSASPVTGAVISEGRSKGTLNITYFFIGAIILTGVFGLIITRKIFRRKISPPHTLKEQPIVQPIEQPKTEREDTTTDSELLDVERKVKEVQEEIKRIKNKGKIKEAENKLEEDKEELEKLKRGNE